MNMSLESRKKTFLIPFFAISCAISISIFLFSTEAPGGPPASSSINDSISIGLPMRGLLLKGEVLPKKGAGYELMASTKARKSRFGVYEMIMLIKDVSYKVKRKHKGEKLQVGDISARKGGKIEHHGSHQNGRDVDFMFYFVDKSKKPAKSSSFIPFDANGYSINPPMKYKFDVKRNWALVNNLIKSQKARVQWIFVANHIKKILLTYAEKHESSPSIIRKARQILHQPSKSSHWDHFHVRIYCPRGDKPKCKDVGPRWAWIK